MNLLFFILCPHPKLLYINIDTGYFQYFYLKEDKSIIMDLWKLVHLSLLLITELVHHKARIYANICI